MRNGSQQVLGKHIVGDPHVGDVDAQREEDDGDEEEDRPEFGMCRQFKSNDENN